jgi:hypothetical protein
MDNNNNSNNYNLGEDFNDYHNWLLNRPNKTKLRTDEQISILEAYKIALMVIEDEKIMDYYDMFTELMINQMKREAGDKL